MQSKYKVGLMRINLVVAAGLAAGLALASENLPDALLLGLATAWLGVTATQVELSHRHPATIPWQLLPGLLLAALLWVSPERHLTWLWAWAILLMLPQPRWILGFHTLLAATSWWSLRDLLGLEQWGLAGLLLAGLMLLGLSRSLALQALRRRIRHRARLVPAMALWPGHQLHHDVQQERHRARQEGVHVELLLLRTSRWRLWRLAERLCDLTHRFEPCYRLDRRTLGVLLISTDADQANARRQALLASLDRRSRARVVALPRLGSLSRERRALARQTGPLEIKETAPHG
ncbi:hypothetical protein [Halomonas beimenensis]|uniref:GGDEF domain-containing protein n=1 Tax=Halomonas beimenensis TaxID=475662 RepID=A0A291P8F7_9GAMM|nr:hypothetical protein [Halomonas beimenensis]ATJ83196.1 hypothetical protein BEI_2209 [Halomonas beimenensis]